MRCTYTEVGMVISKINTRQCYLLGLHRTHDYHPSSVCKLVNQIKKQKISQDI